MRTLPSAGCDRRGAGGVGGEAGGGMEQGSAIAAAAAAQAAAHAAAAANLATGCDLSTVFLSVVFRLHKSLPPPLLPPCSLRPRAAALRSESSSAYGAPSTHGGSSTHEADDHDHSINDHDDWLVPTRCWFTCHAREQWLSSGHRDPNRQSEEGDPAHTQVSPSSPAASFFWSLTRHSPHVAHANLPYTWQFAYIYMTICLHIHYGPFCVCVCRSAHDPMYPPRPLSTEAASVGVSMWCGCHHGGQLPLSAGTAPPIGAAGEGAAMRRAGDGARVTVSVSNRSRLVTMPSALRGGSCRRRVSCGASVSSG